LTIATKNLGVVGVLEEVPVAVLMRNGVNEDGQKIVQNFTAQRYAQSGLFTFVKSAFKEQFWCKIKVQNFCKPDRISL
jgi:hypothetical protein